MTHEGIEMIAGFVAGSGLTTGSIGQRRAAMDATTGATRPPEGVTVEPTTMGGRPAEWLTPSGIGRDRAVLYLHGGGYCIGSLDSHRELAGRLALAAGCAVCLLDYRLAPEHAFPGALDDTLAACAELRAGGIDTRGLALAGDSAGGGLALAALLALRDAGDALPAAAACLSPWTDLTQSSPAYDRMGALDPFISREALQPMADAYLAGTDPRTPLASPVNGDLVGLPPLLIEVGEREALLDDSVTFAARAEAAGVDVTLRRWPELVHVFQAFPAEIVPEAAASIAGIGAFLARHLTPSAPRADRRSEQH